MGKNRKVRKVIQSKPTIEGAGVHLKRAFGFSEVPTLDPFLLLDDFHSNHPADYLKGFPWHPHRGIETITYVLHGEVEHGDSMGNTGVISSGDVQWMTAGSGIIHQEMPRGQENGLMWGFQLWANLPASHKMTKPRYRDVNRHQIPEVRLDNGVKIKIVCGEVNNVKGPVEDIIIDPEYLDVEIPSAVEFTHLVPEGYTVFAYVIKGKGHFEPESGLRGYDKGNKDHPDSSRELTIGPESLVIFENGEDLSISTSDEAVRFLLVSGKPIREPIAWYGPIVMNTQEELRIAFEEYRGGTFLQRPN
jgi:redox-sensitive bicupin YhaK (pirin superfamily)